MIAAPALCPPAREHWRRCRWWEPQPHMSGPYACHAPERPVCESGERWCEVTENVQRTNASPFLTTVTDRGKMPPIRS